jgi:long-chain fatty acid transport protein
MIFSAPPTWSAAFYVPEIGTPGSLGTAGVANVTNNFGADSAFANPAGMTGLDRDLLVGGFQVLIPKIEFDPDVAGAGGDDGGNAGKVAAVPSFFAVKKIDERLRLGLSVTAPWGGGMNFGENFVGRYGAQKVELSGAALSPSLGYRLNDKWSVGAGVSVVYTLFNQNIAINNPGPLPDSKVKIENMDDWGLQPFVGVMFQATDRLRLGGLYRGKSDINLRGDLNFRNRQLPSPRPTANSAKLKWNNPQLIRVGASYRLNDEWRLLADADWEDWSEFSDNLLVVQGGTLDPSAAIDRQWRDTWHVGIAAIRKKSNRAYSMGLSYDSSPVSDGKRTIDLPMDRQLKLSAGFATEQSRRFDYALGATLLHAGDGKVDQTTQGVRFKGEFDTNLVLFIGGSVRYNF